MTAAGGNGSRATTGAGGVPLATWLACWRFLQLYHRYTVEGLEHLDGPPALIVGYHGRPLALDMCMLTVALHDRLGYLPHGIVHRGVETVPALKWFADGLGFVTEDGDGVAAAVARGEHIVTTPGGAREGCRDFRHRYEVSWGGHIGYLRLALRHRLPIVPVAAAGADDTYLGLNDAEAVGRWLRVPRRWAWALWMGVGPLGFYPFSPPFPVRLRQLVGAPIDLAAEGPTRLDDTEGLLRLHRRVTGAVQALLDRATGRRPHGVHV
jgi:1-acyl-sn-glycerol-3-phosphate acyltransferase